MKTISVRVPIPTVLTIVLIMLIALSWHGVQANQLPRGDGDTVSSEAPSYGEIAQGGGGAGPSSFFVLGSQLLPRSPTLTWVYTSYGCVYYQNFDGLRTTYPITIPTGSVIKSLVMYFIDTDASLNLTAWITRYSPGQSSIDLTSVSTNSSAGFGIVMSSEITETTARPYQYTINVGWGAIANTNQICGVEVTYYPPTTFPAALPLTLKP